jgi:hypothetical protein
LFYSFFNLDSRRGGWLTSRPGDRFAPGEETWYPMYRGLGGSQGLAGRLRNISPPPGFDSRIIHPVAIHCTDYAIPAHTVFFYSTYICFSLFSQGFSWPVRSKSKQSLRPIVTHQYFAAHLSRPDCTFARSVNSSALLQVLRPTMINRASLRNVFLRRSK